jgi:hypothetical protein
MDAYSSLLKQMSDAHVADLRREAQERAISRVARRQRREAARRSANGTVCAQVGRWFGRLRPGSTPRATPVTAPARPIAIDGPELDEELRQSA